MDALAPRQRPLRAFGASDWDDDYDDPRMGS